MQNPHAVHLSGSISGFHNPVNSIALSLQTSAQLRQIVLFHAKQLNIPIRTSALMAFTGSATKQSLSQATLHSPQNVHPRLEKSRKGDAVPSRTTIPSSHTLLHADVVHSTHPCTLLGINPGKRGKKGTSFSFTCTRDTKDEKNPRRLSISLLQYLLLYQMIPTYLQQHLHVAS